MNVPVVAVEDTERVSVEEALPPTKGVTLVGENAAVTPLGKPPMLRLVAELKPFTLPIVTVALPLLPWTTLNEVGETATVKSGGRLIVRVRLAEWLRLLAVPVMVTVKVLAVAVDEAARVSVEEALPPAAGITLDGENAAVTPLGKPPMLRLVAELKPFTLPIVTVPLLLLPWMTFNDAGAVRVKSCGGEPMVKVRLAECPVFPALPLMITVYVPGTTEEEAVRVKVDDALPPAGSVTLVGDKLALTPLGKLPTDRLMLLLKPAMLPTVTVVLPLVAGERLSELEDKLRLKSGLGGGGEVMVTFNVVL